MEWIHISDGLPDDDGFHIVCYGRGTKEGRIDLRPSTLFIGTAHYVNGQWWLSVSYWFQPIILFWMPHPKPPTTPQEYYSKYELTHTPAPWDNDATAAD